MPTTKKTTPKRAGKTQRLDETPSSPVLVGEVVKKQVEIAKNKVGRPTMYNDTLALEICERIAMGESLREITADSHMPDRIQILRWLNKHSEFRTQYTKAKEDQADSYEDAMLHTARTEEDVQRARLIIDTMKWTASKLKPKKYGDKLDLTSDGKQMPAPIISIAAVPQNKEINS